MCRSTRLEPLAFRTIKTTCSRTFCDLPKPLTSAVLLFTWGQCRRCWKPWYSWFVVILRQHTVSPFPWHIIATYHKPADQLGDHSFWKTVVRNELCRQLMVLMISQIIQKVLFRGSFSAVIHFHDVLSVILRVIFKGCFKQVAERAQEFRLGHFRSFFGRRFGWWNLQRYLRRLWRNRARGVWWSRGQGTCWHWHLYQFGWGGWGSSFEFIVS